ncbi:hypothetical protein H9636_00660 [Ureibacillus sp. Re31]|uniref:DNA mismatch repair proteins mutS family domain-containing protein n=1 Tax=Ureibacillus galli TaxID=2762222 RepID=A0ABR8X762_9BACL|nr:hypothetical protein [Ureibacillus galli]MBD8025155.1 hypothetical protein [Ureibacillus galli]
MYILISITLLFGIYLYINFTQKKKIEKIIEAEWKEKKILSSRDNMKSVATYWMKHSKNSNYLGVDSITWHDLSMDDVFHKINYTQTSVGSEYLYDQLHRIQLSDNQQNESLYELMSKDHRLRNRLLFELKKLGKRNYVDSSSFFRESFGNIRHIWLYIGCSFLPIISIIVAIFNLKIGIISIFFSILLNISIYYTNKLKLDSNLYGTSYVANMIATGKKLSKINDKNFQPYATKIIQSIKPIRKFLFFEKIISLGRGTGEFEGLFEYVRIIFLLDFISYYYMIRMLQSHKAQYKTLWQTIGELDSGIAVAYYRHSLDDYCKPTFIEEEEIIFHEMYHPLIKDPVKNSSHLNKLTLITGSNASGKSTYMKAVAINAILAQTINTVLANQWSMKPSFVISSMAVQDNVIEGDSYFKAEIKSLKRITKLIDSKIPCLSFIDEILRGTNTIERIAASASIMEWLSTKNGMNLIASHDIELTNIAHSIYDNYHFREIVKENGIFFDYKIHPGPSSTKNAIKLLEVMDFPLLVTERAHNLANDFENNRIWQILS